jgi:hypothetical protein
MAETDRYRGVYAGLEEGRDACFFCGTKTGRERARAGPNTRGDGRDLYRGAQLVLRRPRLHADLAMATRIKPLPHYSHRQSTGVRPEEGA